MTDAPTPSAHTPATTGVDDARQIAARETFASIASHALRGVTHSIATALALLSMEVEGETLSARQRELLEIAEGGAARLRLLTDDLATLTHSTAGTLRVKHARASLADLLRAAIMQAQNPLTPDPPREIRTRVTPARASVDCDAQLTRRALAALVENALRFSAPETPVSVEARARDDSVVIRVRDRGAGIAQDARERVFDPLYVGAPPENHVGGGLGVGLGLAVARACAEAQGGRIWLDHADAPGATFVLELPLMPSPDAESSS